MCCSQDINFCVFGCWISEIKKLFYIFGYDISRVEIEKWYTMLFRVIIICLQVKSIAQDLEKLVEDPMYGNTTIGWMDLVLPHILNMLLDPATSVVTAWHLFDPIAR